MANLIVNGRHVCAEETTSLLRFLRDSLHLTSVKDGCSEGACGSCHVLVDGKAVRACGYLTDDLDGHEVLTIEGLSSFEKDVYTYAFGTAGAVQCGFCTPGMIISAKALLDVNKNPTREQAAYAIRNNVCRCTGYVKIIDGILLAAKAFREGRIPDTDAEVCEIGKPIARLDVPEKVQGTGTYCDDVYLDGMCYASPVRSQYARARVLSIDASKALALDGVVGVLTAKDIPGQVLVGHLKKDQPTLIAVGEITHYLGDSIALVCARDEKTLEQAKKLVRVEYEVLPAVHNPEEAAAKGAPLVFEDSDTNLLAHKYFSRGNAEEGIRNSKYVLHQRFSTPWTEHAFLEPECAVAWPTDDGGVMLLSSDQSAHTTLRECALMLGLPPEKCRVQNMLAGGGFGGKEDMSVQHHACLAAYVLQVPVKIKLTRQESILVHPKRHSMKMDFIMGCDENGYIQGVKAKVVPDTGAFASLGGPVLERACTHAAGPYAYENFEIEGWAYYTNNPPAGAFRGFGVTQTCFCTETLLNEMADLVGISPWEIRLRNAIRPGAVLPNGQIAGSETGLVETLEAVKPYYDAAIAAGAPAGLACAMKNAGVGIGIPDWGRCRLIVESDAKVHIYAGASCIGQGIGTVLLQIIGSFTGLRRGDIVYERNNTWIAPDSGDTSGSRQTMITGEACRRASLALHEALQGKTLKDLIGQEFYGEYLAKTDPMGADIPHPKSHIAYGYGTQLCILDKSTGRIQEIVATHDVGKAINPLSCEGQIEGGVVMSMGYALTEQYPIDESCRPTADFAGLGLLHADGIPPRITSIVVDKPGLDVAAGAIGVGEITSVPTAPAIADAYFRYDGKRRYDLPLRDTPYERRRP